MLKQFLEAGKVVGTHGVRGELRVQPLGDGPAFLAQFRTLYLSAGGAPVRVQSARAHKSLALIKLEGVDDMDAAERLRGRVLYFNRKDARLPEGRYFIVDLIGARAVDDQNGRVYGTLTDVIEAGAQDVYEITDDAGQKHLMPAVPEMVRAIHPEQGELRIRPVAGIFDDAD